jgi:hypothetical protein
MPRVKPTVDGRTRPEEFPIAWFGEMLIAIDRGDFERAMESQHELDRLGWRVTRKRYRKAAAGQGGDA